MRLIKYDIKAGCAVDTWRAGAPVRGMGASLNAAQSDAKYCTGVVLQKDRLELTGEQLCRKGPGVPGKQLDKHEPAVRPGRTRSQEHCGLYEQ